MTPEQLHAVKPRRKRLTESERCAREFNRLMAMVEKAKTAEDFAQYRDNLAAAMAHSVPIEGEGMTAEETDEFVNILMLRTNEVVELVAAAEQWVRDNSFNKLPVEFLSLTPGASRLRDAVYKFQLERRKIRSRIEYAEKYPHLWPPPADPDGVENG